MIKGQELIEELGFKLPELELVEDGALEVFFVDKCRVIHGRFGWEAIRWNNNGMCFTHPHKFILVKVNWYDIPSNFPCLVKNSSGVIRIAIKVSEDRVLYKDGIGWDLLKTVIPITLEEVTKLIIKEGKCE